VFSCGSIPPSTPAAGPHVPSDTVASSGFSYCPSDAEMLSPSEQLNTLVTSHAVWPEDEQVGSVDVMMAGIPSLVADNDSLITPVLCHEADNMIQLSSQSPDRMVSADRNTHSISHAGLSPLNDSAVCDDIDLEESSMTITSGGVVGSPAGRDVSLAESESQSIQPVTVEMETRQAESLILPAPHTMLSVSSGQQHTSTCPAECEQQAMISGRNDAADSAGHCNKLSVMTASHLNMSQSSAADTDLSCQHVIPIGDSTVPATYCSTE